MAENRIVWTVATGNFDPFRKKSRDAVKFISQLEGLIAAHPAYPNGMLWLFNSENNAKGARNQMEHNGIQTGRNICKGHLDGGTLVMDDGEEG